MICGAFDVKFEEKKDETPPRPVDLQQKLKKQNVQEVDPHQVGNKQCRTSGPPKS